MIKGKGNNIGKFEDVGVIDQRKEKRLRNNAKHENEWTQKEA